MLQNEFTVDYRIKNIFFDRAGIQKAVIKDGVAFLGHAGGYLRKVARNSMTRKGMASKQAKVMGGKKWQRRQNEIATRPASRPGTPPNAHSPNDLVSLKNILYGYDSWRKTAVVGPVRLNQKQWYGGKLTAGTVPMIHEFGGTVGILEKELWPGRWVPVGRKKPRPGQATRTRRARYPKRPFMAPALQKTIQKFPQLWYGSVNAA